MPNPLETLTLRDLENWDRRDEAGNFLPSLAVLGHPVSHSVSPQMHNAALNELRNARSLDKQRNVHLKDWRYFKFDIEPEQLPIVLPLLLEKKFVGINLTLPHKIKAFDLVKKKSIAAQHIGAVNTLIKAKNGGWEGENTDSYGLAMAVKDDLKLDLKREHVIILGAGGAARGAALQCLREWKRDVWIGARDPVKLKSFLDDLKLQKHEHKAHGFNLASPPIREWNEGVLVINATSAGLKAKDPLPIDLSIFPGNSYLIDMVYSRDNVTSLVKAARLRGLHAVDGLGMLVWQGHKSLEWWTGVKSSAQIMMNAACKALNRFNPNA